MRLYEEVAALKLCSAGSLYRKPFSKKKTFFGAFDVSNCYTRSRREYDHIFVPFRGNDRAVSKEGC